MRFLLAWAQDQGMKGNSGQLLVSHQARGLQQLEGLHSKATQPSTPTFKGLPERMGLQKSSNF